MIAFKLRRVKVQIPKHGLVTKQMEAKLLKSRVHGTSLQTQRHELPALLLLRREIRSTVLIRFRNHSGIVSNIYILELYPSLDEPESLGESGHRRAECSSMLFCLFICKLPQLFWCALKLTSWIEKHIQWVLFLFVSFLLLTSTCYIPTVWQALCLVVFVFKDFFIDF